MNDSKESAETPRGRRRSERARLAILDAAADLLLERGVSGASIEAIASRAGVSKATIYRWWPTRGHVMFESLFERTLPTMRRDPGDSTAQALTRQTQNFVDLVSDHVYGALIRQLVVATQSDEGLRETFIRQWLNPRREISAAIIADGVERGEIRADLDVSICLDQLFAPIYYRLLFGHGPLDGPFARRVVEQALAGVSAPG
jgi:AcrR family transcriptional regulator